MVFNYQSGTFAGSFKIYVYIAMAIELSDLAMNRLESISGWMHSRPPTTLLEVIFLVEFAVLCYQAVAYPGISQVSSQEKDD